MEKSEEASIQRPEEKPSSVLLFEISDLIWNTQITEAQKKILATKDEKDQSERMDYKLGLELSLISWLRSMITEDEKDINMCLKVLSQVQDVANDIISKAKRYSEQEVESARIAIGFDLLLRAILQFRIGSYVRGALNIRSAWKIFAEALSKTQFKSVSSSSSQKSSKITIQDPDTVGQIIFCVCILEFGVSLIPSTFRWIIEYVGFPSGNRSLSMHLLNHCNSSSLGGPTLIEPFANFFKLWILTFFYENWITAETFLHKILSEYPTSVLYLFMGSHLYRKRLKCHKAIRLLRSAIQISKVEIPEFEVILLHELGECYFLLTDWKNSVLNYKSFLDQSKSTAYRCFAIHNLGIAYVMLGEDKKAIGCFELCPKYKRSHFAFDLYAARKAGEYLNHFKTHGTFLDEIEQRLILGNLYRRSGQLANSLEELEACDKQLKEKGETGDRRGVKNYYKGRTLREMRDMENAKKQFRKVIEAEKEMRNEEWIVVHSMNEMAEVMMIENNWEEAETWVRRGLTWKARYDFDKPLGRKLKRNLDLVLKKETLEQSSPNKEEEQVEEEIVDDPLLDLKD